MYPAFAELVLLVLKVEYAADELYITFGSPDDLEARFRVAGSFAAASLFVPGKKVLARLTPVDDSAK